MCVCMYVYTHIHTYMCMCIYIYIYIHTYLCICTICYSIVQYITSYYATSSGGGSWRSA